MTLIVGVTDTQSWTPTMLGSALTAWYDAEDSATVTVSGTAVTQWDDKSGNANHATQSTGADQPSYASNRITFDGTSDFLNVTGISMSSTSRFVGAVAQIATGESGEQRIVGPTNDSAFAVAARSDAGNVMGFSKTNVKFFGGGAVVTTAADHVMIWNLTSSTYRTSYNGTASSGSHSESFSSGRTMLIGKEVIGTTSYNRLNGSLRELIIASELSTANQQRIEGYLAWKWGLNGNLDAAHPYKSGRP